MSNDRTFEDAFNLLCGEVLGHGIHRKVFACRLRDDLVVKVEDNDGSEWRRFANVLEIEFWHQFQDYDKVGRWLAPCEHLSPDGRILLQKRVSPLPLDYELPRKMPTFPDRLQTEQLRLVPRAPGVRGLRQHHRQPEHDAQERRMVKE